MKSPEMSPPRKGPITNQDSTIIINQQDPIILMFFKPRVPTGHKQFIDETHFPNKTENEHNDSTDNSRNDKRYYVKK